MVGFIIHFFLGQMLDIFFSKGLCRGHVDDAPAETAR